MDITPGSSTENLPVPNKSDIPDGFFGKLIKTKTKDDEPEKIYGKRYRIFYPPYVRKSESRIVPESDTWYKMGDFPRGKMLIINMRNFLPQSGFRNYTREGTGVDVESLVRLFLKLGYIIEVYDDLKKSELLKVMIRSSKASYKNYNSFVCAILTHGMNKSVYATDDCVELRKLTRMFCGENLAGIPKVFLVQACQGTEYIENIDEVDGLWRKSKETENESGFSLPAEADFLYSYSTVPGYYSWRDCYAGSWFIQTICRVFASYAKDVDIVRMLTKVNELIANMTLQVVADEGSDMRQVCSLVSQLKKEFYFFPPS